MTAPGQSTWDGNPLSTPPVTVPYRPGSADFNGIGLVDSQVYPPDPSTMPTAPLLNTQSALGVVFGRMIPNLTISIRYDGVPNPVIDSFTAAPSGVSSGTFTIARTGGGAANGDITITWPANTFPAAITQPKVSLNGTAPGMACVSAVSNGMRIVTKNPAGAATDLPFTADLM